MESKGAKLEEGVTSARLVTSSTHLSRCQREPDLNEKLGKGKSLG